MFFQDASQSQKSDKINFVKGPYPEYAEHIITNPKSAKSQIDSNMEPKIHNYQQKGTYLDLSFHLKEFKKC